MKGKRQNDTRRFVRPGAKFWLARYLCVGLAPYPQSLKPRPPRGFFFCAASPGARHDPTGSLDLPGASARRLGIRT